MRLLAIAAFVLLALLLALHFVVPDARQTSPPTLSSNAVPASSESAAPAEEIPAAEELGSDGSIALATESERTSLPQPENQAACSVFGRVTDEADSAIQGVIVQLHAVHEWKEGIDVPRLPGDGDLVGWVCHTDELGNFRFDVPVPSAEVVELTITPDTYHECRRATLGGSGSWNLAPVHAGENDLGVFRLVASGAIEGRVTDGSGQPLAGASLHVDQGPRRDYLERVLSDEEGHFSIPHAPEGIYGLRARLQGYLTVPRDGLRVEVGKTVAGIDIVLLPAPTLCGNVSDDSGMPIEGVVVRGTPTSTGAGTSAISASDGTFVVYLPQDKPYALSAECEGFDPFNLHRIESAYKPGTTGIEIVLHRAEKTLFRVVDAESEQPVEEFGLMILRDNGKLASPRTSTSSGPPPIVAHAGGIVELDARAGIDKYFIVATGFCAKEDEIEHVAGSSALQVISLERGATVRGRAVIDGLPCSDVVVVLSQGHHEQGAASDLHPESSLSGGLLRRTVDEEIPGPHWQGSGQEWRTTTGADGVFAFTVLDPSTYCLEAIYSSGRSALIAPIEVGIREKRDLGDIQLLPGAAVVGHVLVPQGRQLDGLSVYLDDWRSTGMMRTTDASGSFEFSGLTEGTHSLFLAEEKDSLVASDRFFLVLAPGETREVVLDARDRGVCSVTLVFDLGGRASPEGMNVTLVSVNDPRTVVGIGRTDESGRVTASVRAIGLAYARIQTRDMITLVERSRIFAMDLDAKIDERIFLDVGGLDITFAGSTAIPEDITIQMALTPLGNPDEATVEWGSYFSARSGEGSTVVLDRAARRLMFAVLPAGKFELAMEIVERENPSPASVYSRRVAVEIPSGGMGSVQLD